MGGTFDPIHHGHLAAASEAVHAFSLDKVLFIPAGEPWQKDQNTVSPAEDRYVMTVLATAADVRFEVSRVDLDRPGPTYTVDTLTLLHEKFGDDCELFFIAGSDALSQVFTWHDFERVAELAHFIGVNRPGQRLSDPRLANPQEPLGRVSMLNLSFLEVPDLAISSTDCRERVASGRPIEYLVPAAVARYIDKRGLYRGQS